MAKAGNLTNDVATAATNLGGCLPQESAKDILDSIVLLPVAQGSVANPTGAPSAAPAGAVRTPVGDPTFAPTPDAAKQAAKIAQTRTPHL